MDARTLPLFLPNQARAGDVNLWLTRALQGNDASLLSQMFSAFNVNMVPYRHLISTPADDMPFNTGLRYTTLIRQHQGEYPFEPTGAPKPWFKEALPGSGNAHLLNGDLNKMSHVVITSLFDGAGNIQPWLRDSIGAANLQSACQRFGETRVKIALFRGALLSVCSEIARLHAFKYNEFVNKLYELARIQTDFLTHYYNSRQLSDAQFSEFIANPRKLYEFLARDIHIPPADLSLLYAGEHYRNTSSLDALGRALRENQGPAGDRYREYREDLIRIAGIIYTKDMDRANISTAMINFLKKAFFNALNDHGIDMAKINMELCVAGSLARSEATPYSDVDCFLIFGDDVPVATKKKIQDISQQVYYVMMVLFSELNQFMMDPVGISIGKLNGTVNELVALIPTIGMPASAISTLNAKSVFGRSDLLDALKARIAQQFDARFYYTNAVEEFPGPKLNSDTIIMKADLIRTVDFLLQGLRIQANLSAQDFSDPKLLLNELLRQKRISPGVYKLIQYVKEQTYIARHDWHGRHQHETEIIPRNFHLDRLTDLVAWLRGSLSEWLRSGKGSLPTTTFDLIPGKYLTAGEHIPTPQPEFQAFEHVCIMQDALENAAKNEKNPARAKVIRTAMEAVKTYRGAMLETISALPMHCLELYQNIRDKVLKPALEECRKFESPPQQRRDSSPQQQFFKEEKSRPAKISETLQAMIRDIDEQESRFRSPHPDKQPASQPSSSQQRQQH